MKTKVALTFVLVIWVLAISVGLRQMTRYAFAEGVPGSTPSLSNNAGRDEKGGADAGK